MQLKLNKREAVRDYAQDNKWGLVSEVPNKNGILEYVTLQGVLVRFVFDGDDLTLVQTLRNIMPAEAYVKEIDEDG